MSSQLDHASNVSTEESSYDVFVSYARRDNNTGWITHLVERLRQARPSPHAPPLDVFFDATEIHGLDDWSQRIEGALRRSHVLMVCLSPAWSASEYCRLEQQIFDATRQQRHKGVPMSVAVVRMAEVASTAVHDAATQAVLRHVGRSQYLLDLAQWFADMEGNVRSPRPGSTVKQTPRGLSPRRHCSTTWIASAQPNERRATCPVPMKTSSAAESKFSAFTTHSHWANQG